MELSRTQKLKLNIVSSFGMQVVTMLCGLLIPRLMLASFGSETYGLATSISDFLSYISLVDGGVGGVARAAMYGPLAKKDMQQVSNVHYELKKFLRIVGTIFVGYALVLAVGFQGITGKTGHDWFFTFSLVLAIALSTFAEYFFSLNRSLLVHAAQRVYVNNSISILTTVLNTLFVVVLLKLRCSLVVVKLTSSLIYILRPIILAVYIRRKLPMPPPQKDAPKQLTQKWEGMGQHMASFLHAKADVVILTFFGQLANVAVYSVYHMVLVCMQKITESFASGTEALFGNMLAKKEMKELRRWFDDTETGLSIMSMLLFSVTAVLLPSFVLLYTRGIRDAQYDQPAFALMMCLYKAVACVRKPYRNMVVAAGRFRQTRPGAYGETVLNIGISLLLVGSLGLTGIAVGTLVSALFCNIYYAWYVSRFLLERPFRVYWKRLGVNLLCFLGVYLPGTALLAGRQAADYFHWALWGFGMVAFAAAVNLAVNFLLYPADTRRFAGRLLNKLKGKR